MALRVDGLVTTSGLPEASGCGAVRSIARGVLFVFVAEEVPVVLILWWVVPNPAHFLEIPGLDFVEVQLLNELVSLRSSHFAVQVIPNQLLVSWMEPKSHWNGCIVVVHRVH